MVRIAGNVQKKKIFANLYLRRFHVISFRLSKWVDWWFIRLSVHCCNLALLTCIKDSAKYGTCNKAKNECLIDFLFVAYKEFSLFRCVGPQDKFKNFIKFTLYILNIQVHIFQIYDKLKLHAYSINRFFIFWQIFNI